MHELLQEIRRQIRGMLRYRWSAMFVVWILCVGGWVLVYAMPNIYEARAQVYVDADSRLAKLIGQVGVLPGVGSRVFVVRQAMLARPQLEKVARETDLDLRATTREEKEELFVSLRNNLSVSSGRKSETRNLYTIAFQDPDRAMAVAVVQKLLDTFVDDVLKLKEQGTEEVNSYLEEQLTHYSRQLFDAEQKLADFKKKYVGLLPGETGGIFERLQIELNLVKQLQLELQIETDRREELRRQLKNEPPQSPDEENGLLGIGVPGSTTGASIRELERRRADLLLRYTEQHPDVVAAAEQLDQLYKQRTLERNALRDSSGGMEGVPNSTNPVYQSVQIALNESGVLIAGLRSQLQQRQAVLRQLNEQVNTIPEVEAEYAQLTRDYDQFKVLYSEIMIRKERERLGKVGEERDVVSFNIIEPPAAALEPVAPKRVILLIGVLVLGLSAGGGIAFILHQIHPVYHDAHTLRQVTGQPVLGVVSMTWLDQYHVHRRAGMTSYMLAGAGLVLLFAATLTFQDVWLSLMQTVKLSIAG